MISTELLIKYHATLKNFEKNVCLFQMNDTPRFYYQIEQGEAKVFNNNKEGKEFIHFILSSNRGIGEAALFGNFNYPTSCQTTKNSKIWLLSKDNFKKLLMDNQEVHFDISKTMANRLFFKSLISKEISIENPEHKILALLDYLKEKIYAIENPYEYKVELSRQQIADLIGLRVETVIRTVKSLEKQNKVKIKNFKIYR